MHAGGGAKSFMSIHPTAVVHPDAVLADAVEIGPFCVIGPHVSIGCGARLMSHVVVDGWTRVGDGCRIFPFACLGTETQDLKYRGAKTSVEIGSGTTIREYVTINSGTAENEVTRIGSGCLLMAYAHVAHGSLVGDQVIMANCATLAGHVVVEDQAVVGGLAAVHQFVRIGRMCMIGGCSKIAQDCPPFMLVDGNPAEVRGPNTVGLQRRGVSAASQRAIKEAYRWIYRKSLGVSEALAGIEQSDLTGPEVDHLVQFVRASERGIIR